jgi:SAM-dependent methyltransferase
MSILRRLQQHFRFLVHPEGPRESVSRPLSTTDGPTLQVGQVDVRDLIARYDYEKHAQLADAYFAPLLENPIIRRKPFAHIEEAIQIMSGFSNVIEGLRLFPQAEVLDFGAGTCWSSRILACLGCRVTALDVSGNALRIGKSIQEQDPITKGLPIEYSVFNGRSIPVERGTFDRVLSFDAFHHVADQGAVLAEFARVLRNDGIVGFAEPGPYNVIENDIRVEEIWEIAKACGFADIRLSFAMPRQELMTLDEFNRVLALQSAPDDVVFSPTNAAIHKNRRVFFLYKSLTVETDSRFADGLHGDLRLQDAATIDARKVRITLEIKNTGANAWRPSGLEPGSVNIGAHLRRADGDLVDNDFARLPVFLERVTPGQILTVTGDLPLPSIDDFDVELDLVSEGVTWFEMMGVKPLTLSFRNRLYRGES